MPIFDQGYQHWKGAVSGHAWRWMAIARQGLIGQIKATRSYIRVLFLMAFIPALLLVVTMALWGLIEQKSETVLGLAQSILSSKVAADPHAYRHAVWTIAYSIFFQVELYMIMLLVVMAGPNLISRDLRFNALPLYFSRPITRFDYFLGKLGVIAALVAAVAVVPAVVAYIMGICFSLDLTVFRDTWRLLPATIFYGLIIVVSAGTLILALSSLSRRSLYVGIAWIGLWIIGSTVSTALEGIEQASLFHSIHSEAMAEENRQMNSVPQDPKESPTARNERRHRVSMMGWQERQRRIEQAQAEMSKTNWRPLCSYVANLRRVGEALLDTDSAWVEIGRAAEGPRVMAQSFVGHGAPAPVNERVFADKFVPQYPWIWSAGVLAGLLGLSICILSTRVKSLDRLK